MALRHDLQTLAPFLVVALLVMVYNSSGATQSPAPPMPPLQQPMDRSELAALDREIAELTHEKTIRSNAITKANELIAQYEPSSGRYSDPPPPQMEWTPGRHGLEPAR